MGSLIYLDNAATTKPRQEVIDAMMPYLTEKWFNPSSLYGGGVDVRKDVEAARKIIADFINCEPEEIYFTSSASEANSWALQGFIGDTLNTYSVISTAIEHKSILSCLDAIKERCMQVDLLNMDKNGLIDVKQLKELLWEHDNDYKVTLVSVGMANNEIGTIQDIKTISDLTHKYCGVLHIDATQALGQIPIDVKEMGIDMMSVSGHKLGCPKGIGFLYIKNSIKIKPLIYGSQERGQRGGTENVAGIIGFAKAVELSHVNDGEECIQMMCDVRDYVIDILKEKFNCKLNGHDEYRLPNNINVTFPQNISGEALLYTLDLEDIAIGIGSACNSKSIEPSYVLKTIGLSDEEAMKTIRISLPWILDYSVDEYEELIDKFINEIKKAIRLIESEV